MEIYPPFLVIEKSMVNYPPADPGWVCGLNKLAKITAVLGSSFRRLNGYILYAGSL